MRTLRPTAFLFSILGILLIMPPLLSDVYAGQPSSSTSSIVLETSTDEETVAIVEAQEKEAQDYIDSVTEESAELLIKYEKALAESDADPDDSEKVAKAAELKEAYEDSIAAMSEYQYEQLDYSTDNEIIIDFDGNPSSITGTDHDMDGTALDSEPNLAAVAMGYYDGTYIDGPTGTSGPSGISTTGVAETEIEGGINNSVDPTRYGGIEEFIQSVKFGADLTIDTSGTEVKDVKPSDLNPTDDPDGLGTKDNPVVIYASPSSLTKEMELRFAGSEEIYGTLVIEVNDPKFGGLQMNGNFKWIGAVIIVVNYRDNNNTSTGNSVPLSLAGGGAVGDGQIIGGAIVYNRNQENTGKGANAGGDIFGKTQTNVSGGGKISYSSSALSNAKVKASFQVKSWRKLVE